MRIISGSARGRKIVAPPGMGTRPTSDRVRESMFNILASIAGFSDIAVLDICAGSGALGIESLSRGAAHACFIENNGSTAYLIKKNLSALSFTSVSKVISSDAKAALQRGRLTVDKFDLIFFDPPYTSPLYSEIIRIVADKSLLNEQGILVVESSAKMKVLPSETTQHLSMFDRRVYGDTAISFYNRGEP